jgi:hypothetical protein
MTQTLTRIPHIQSIAGNKHELAAHAPYVLYKNRSSYTETLRTAAHSTEG